MDRIKSSFTSWRPIGRRQLVILVLQKSSKCGFLPRGPSMLLLC